MLREDERSASAQSHNLDGLGENRKVSDSADDPEGEERVKIGMEEDGIVPNVCSSFAELAVLLTGRGGRREVQELTDVMFEVFFDA